MSEPCPTPSTTPTGQMLIPRTSTEPFWLSIVLLPFRFLGRLFDATDQAMSAQVIAFCILFPFSVYWLQTRTSPSAQWTICFGTIWGAIALHEYFRHRGGDK